MEGRTESWLDAASAFQPFYTGSKELLENNFKSANRFTLLSQQMKDLPDAPSEVLKDILRKKDSAYSDLEKADLENGMSGRSSPHMETKEMDQSSGGSSSEDSDQDEDYGKEGEDKKRVDDPENKEVELKKARVENIITSIQHSPRSNSEVQNGSPLTESRRKKRKQNQPQQHDSAVADSKYFKMDERSVVQQQLREMQQQLACIQKRYSKLFDDAPSDEEFDTSPLVIDVDDARTKSTSPLSAESKIKNSGSNNNNSSKTENEDDRCSSRMTSAELQDLNKSLKSEIVAAVGSAIDSVVKKFLERAPVKKEAIKPVKESFSELKSPVPPVPVADLPKKVENPFERFDDAKHRLRTKVSDKHLNNYFEHMAAARAYPLEVPLPFPRFFSPPSLYYPPTQVPLPQPLPPPPKAPEQTEALSLVCPPKKKRTKVTDTRLSPRAARALLQEPVPTRTSESSHHSSADIFSPSLQTSLPTSVAIPNPSLQHSDVLAMYSRGDFSIMNDSNLSSMTHSPSMGERRSPSEARTPTDALSISSYMKKEEDNSSNEESCYSGGMGTISFFRLILLFDFK